MKITILCDNESESGRFLTEHGYSCWIETETPEGEAVRILFDTGQSDIFLTNAARLEVDVKTNHYTVISHGHYDHGGGISGLLKEAPHSRIYLSSKAFSSHLKGDVGEMYYYCRKNVGIAPPKNKKFRNNFIPLEGELSLEKNITLLPPAPAVHPMSANRDLCEVDGEGKLRKDNFDHEVYLAVQEGKELFLFTGCAHRGIANVAVMAQERFPGMDRYTLIGGFHLTRDEENIQIGLLKEITRTEPERWRFVSGHCTGKEKVELLREELTSPVQYAYGGNGIIL
ncbi:MAG: MBL fold metallo-hydrolase [Spirochaetales bacterium]|nr:MBL fold metallo-hydrolase [Spirochaetales bacterium]